MANRTAEVRAEWKAVWRFFEGTHDLRLRGEDRHGCQEDGPEF